jgi:hypothetical protein
MRFRTPTHATPAARSAARPAKALDVVKVDHQPADHITGGGASARARRVTLTARSLHRCPTDEPGTLSGLARTRHPARSELPTRQTSRRVPLTTHAREAPYGVIGLALVRGSTVPEHAGDREHNSERQPEGDVADFAMPGQYEAGDQNRRDCDP